MAAWQPSQNSMRYLSSLLLAFLLLLAPAFAKSAKRPSGKQSSLSSIRDKQKINRKPLVYNYKTNRPLVAKKPHWWQRR
jgi:hypothetical protein